MTSSFDLSTPDSFTAGTVGPPGQRVFYLQVREDNLLITLRCEKQQVAALSEYLDGLLGDLAPAPYGVAVEDSELAEPVDEAWTIGPIGVAYDDSSDRILVVLEELVDDEESDEGAAVRVRLTRAQVAAFVNRGRELVLAGRPVCPFCGGAMDPEGHPCPRMN